MAPQPPTSYDLDPGVLRQTVWSVMGGASRSGDWDPPAELKVYCVMGGVELDFRRAELLPGRNEIHVLVLMGGVKITVPRDLAVDVRATPWMGAVETRAKRPGARERVRRAVDTLRGRDAEAAEPTELPDDDLSYLVIRGHAIMGGIEIHVA